MNIALKRKATPAFIFTFAALMVVLMLFYIDEGNYSFENITHPGNILALTVYLIGITATQFLIYFFTKKYMYAKQSVLLSALLGIPLGVFITVTFFWAISPYS